MVDIFGCIFQSCSGRRYVLELLLLFRPVMPKGSCRNFHLCWNCGRKYFQITLGAGVSFVCKSLRTRSDFWFIIGIPWSFKRFYCPCFGRGQSPRNRSWGQKISLLNQNFQKWSYYIPLDTKWSRKIITLWVKKSSHKKLFKFKTYIIQRIARVYSKYCYCFL